MLEQFGGRDAVLDVGRGFEPIPQPQASAPLDHPLHRRTAAENVRRPMQDDLRLKLARPARRRRCVVGETLRSAYVRTHGSDTPPVAESSRQSAGAAWISAARGPPGVVLPR